MTLNEALDHAAEELNIERSDHAKELGKMVANLQD